MPIKMPISSTELQEICTRLSNNDPTLTWLDLSGNAIGAVGAQAVAAALKKNSTLTWLDLSDNAIGAVGAQAVAAALKKNSTLTSLNLMSDTIRDAGAKALAEALKQNSTLTSVNLWENAIGDEGAAAIQRAVVFNNSTLTWLGGEFPKLTQEAVAANEEGPAAKQALIERELAKLSPEARKQQGHVIAPLTALAALTIAKNPATFVERVKTAPADIQEKVASAKTALQKYGSPQQNAVHGRQ